MGRDVAAPPAGSQSRLPTFGELHTRLETIESVVWTAIHRLDILEERARADVDGLDDLERRVQTSADRLGDLEKTAQMDKGTSLTSRVAGLAERLGSLREEMTSIGGRVMSLGDRVGSLGDRVTSMGERVTLMGEACRARVACTVVGRVGISNMEAISKTSSPSTAVDPAEHGLGRRR